MPPLGPPAPGAASDVERQVLAGDAGPAEPLGSVLLPAGAQRGKQTVPEALLRRHQAQLLGQVVVTNVQPGQATVQAAWGEGG